MKILTLLLILCAIAILLYITFMVIDYLRTQKEIQGPIHMKPSIRDFNCNYIGWNHVPSDKNIGRCKYCGRKIRMNFYGEWLG